VKVLAPTPLMCQAAEVLATVRDSVVVFGAVAVEVALADASISVTPTRDVDLVVETEDANDIVQHLESLGLRRSEIPHEASFTWVRGDLKIQLVRPFHPFPTGAAERLPSQPTVAVARNPKHRHEVGFSDSPELMRFLCVTSACLVALKRQAFGRTRAGEDTPVDRDYCDVYLVLRQVPNAVLDDFEHADQTVRIWVEQAVDLLADDREAQSRAAHEAVRSNFAASVRTAEADVKRTATRFRRRLHERFPVAARRPAARPAP
jgi:hypothetical protein